MMTARWIGLGFLCIAIAALAAEHKNLFVSNEHGVSMEAPLSGDATNLQIAVFFLAASNNFAANVNLQKQKFAGTLEAYDKLSSSQFTQFGLSMLNRNFKPGEVRYEYKGDMQGRPAHWYARAIKAGEYVYLVTATGLEDEWPKQKTILMKSVDSFALSQ